MTFTFQRLLRGMSPGGQIKGDHFYESDPSSAARKRTIPKTLAIALSSSNFFWIFHTPAEFFFPICQQFCPHFQKYSPIFSRGNVLNTTWIEVTALTLKPFKNIFKCSEFFVIRLHFGTQFQNCFTEVDFNQYASSKFSGNFQLFWGSSELYPKIPGS